MNKKSFFTQEASPFTRLASASLITFAFALSAKAHVVIQDDPSYRAVLAPLSSLKAIKAPMTIQDQDLEVGIAFLDGKQREKLLMINHSQGKCGGFELLPEEKSISVSALQDDLKSLRERTHKDRAYAVSKVRSFNLDKKPEIQKALDQVSEKNLEDTVRWFSSFKNRYNRGNTPNAHVTEFKKKIEDMMATSKLPWKIDLISHQSTSQKSTRVHIEGKTRPSEIIVLGGHYDSINQGWSGDRNLAPGADDNASGSANLMEALRIMSQGEQPERSVEFFWYAGEESGLLGSAEIARDYKNRNQDVVAVLQLDMTAYAGEGEMVFGNFLDNTSPWLQDLFREINRVYLGGRLIDDKCGYGCSDHASWYHQGYATMLPFEAGMNSMNPEIHSTRDTIDNKLNFKHASAFSRLALAFAMELSNTSARQP